MRGTAEPRPPGAVRGTTVTKSAAGGNVSVVIRKWSDGSAVPLLIMTVATAATAVPAGVRTTLPFAVLDRGPGLRRSAARRTPAALPEPPGRRPRWIGPVHATGRPADRRSPLHEKTCAWWPMFPTRPADRRSIGQRTELVVASW